MSYWLIHFRLKYLGMLDCINGSRKLIYCDFSFSFWVTLLMDALPLLELPQVIMLALYQCRLKVIFFVRSSEYVNILTFEKNTSVSNINCNPPKNCLSNRKSIDNLVSTLCNCHLLLGRFFYVVTVFLLILRLYWEQVKHMN